jgi:phage-related minor tail protein
LRQLAAEIGKLALSTFLKNLILGGGSGATPAAKGLAFPGGMTLNQGVYNNPTLFKFAHGGRLGLLAEAGRPEAVLPLTRTSGGDLGVKAQAGNTEVNINNYSGAPVREERRQLSDREIVDITIGEVQAAVGRGGNALSRTFESSYGLRRGRG